MGQITSGEKKGKRHRSGGLLAGSDVVEEFIDSVQKTEWKDSPLVYISGPMVSEGNPYVNITDAVLAGVLARQKGWAVIVPHLDCLYAMITGIKDVQYYIENDLNQLSRCDAVCVLPFKVEYNESKEQSGTSTELDFAEDHNIPIFTVETLPTAAEFDASCEVTD